MNRYQVPVMVTFQSENPLDSQQVAKLVHGRFADVYHEQDNDPLVVNIDGIPSDKDDPNSPPVPATPLPAPAHRHKGGVVDCTCPDGWTLGQMDDDEMNERRHDPGLLYDLTHEEGQ